MFSTITVKARPKDTEAGKVWICLATRTPEVIALTRIGKSPARQLNPLHERVILLERVAMQPSRYPHERDVPRRGLNGVTLYKWIGKRVGLDYREVKQLLDDASRVMRALS